MKKTILITVLLLAASFNMQAQLFKLGIKAGLNYANQNGSQITINNSNYTTSAITSYHAGLIAEIKLINSFSVQPELLYSTQGANYKNAVEEFNNELGYITMPVIAKINLNKVVSIELGPQVSFLLSEKNNFNVKDANTFDFAEKWTIVRLYIGRDVSMWLCDCKYTRNYYSQPTSQNK